MRDHENELHDDIRHMYFKKTSADLGCPPFFFGSSSPRSIGHKDGEEKLVQIAGLTFKSSTSEI